MVPQAVPDYRLSVTRHPTLILLGKQIRQLREAAGWSQEDFAAAANLDRAYYGGIERGERNVAALNLIVIAKALKIEVGELFPRLSVLDRRK